MNFLTIISLGSSIAGALASAYVAFASGQTVTLPSVRTYIDGKHVEMDITIKPLA